jgi:hypothetical protein
MKAMLSRRASGVRASTFVAMLMATGLATSAGCGSADPDDRASSGAGNGGGGSSGSSGSSGTPEAGNGGEVVARGGVSGGGSAGVAAGAAGLGVTPPGGAGVSAGAGGIESMPVTSACVEVLRLAHTVHGLSGQATVTRLADGFAALPSAPQAAGWVTHVGAESNQWRALLASAEVTGYLPPVSAGRATEPRLVFFDRRGAVGLENSLLASVVHSDGSVAHSDPDVSLLSIFDDGRSVFATASSLDGERIAVGTGHGATDDPHFALLDRDAKPVGSQLSLFDSANAPSFKAFALTGTAHGVLASVIDDKAGVLHLLELDGAGKPVIELAWPVPAGAGPPRITVDPTGIYVGFKANEGAPNAGVTTVYRAADATLLAVGAVPVGHSWVIGGAEPLLATSPSGGKISFARLHGGVVEQLAGTFEGSLVPSADGRIFLANQKWNDAIPPDTELTVIEVACGASHE